jgi:hypothetical protein
MSIIPLIALLASATATVPQHSVDPGLGTGTGSLCLLTPRQQVAFDALFRTTGPARSRITTVRRRLSANSVETRKRADFAAALQWNGLPLIAAELVDVANAESEGMHTRSLVFRLPLRSLQAALGRIGLSVPVAPGYARIEMEPFAGAARIARRRGGSALTCAWDL